MVVVFSLPKYKGTCIYLIIAPNLKPYVGQTIEFRARMCHHKSAGKLAWINHAKWKAGKRRKVSSISFAINKHGWENMCVTILEKFAVWDQQLLDEREKHFIRFYESFKHGYNETEGGNSGGPHSEETKAKMSAGSMGIGAKPVTSREIKEEYANGTQLVEFVCYASAAEAGRQTKMHKSNISKCCLKREGCKSAGNRYWHYTKEDDLVGAHVVPHIGDKPMPAPEQRKRALFSKSPEGVNQLHEGSRAAGRTLSKSTGKKFSQGHISACCLGNGTHHHGYKFWYATPEKIAEFHNEQKITKKIKRRRMF